MKNFAFALACGLGATAPSAAGLSVNFSFTQESYSPGETTYHLFVTPSSPNIQLIGIGGYSSSLFTFSSSADLIHQDGEPGDSFLGWGESDTGFTPEFPAFEGKFWSRRLKASTTTRVCTLQFLASVNLLKSLFRPRPNSHLPGSRVIWLLGKKLISISSSTVFLHQAHLHHSCAWASEQDDESVRSDRWT